MQDNSGIAVYDRWTAMWNGELDPADVMADTFVLRYAQVGAEHFNSVTDADHFRDAVRTFRDAKPGIRFAVDGPVVADLDEQGSGLVARPYLASVPAADGTTTRRTSGTDMLRVVAGQIVEVWSVSAPGATFYPTT